VGLCLHLYCNLLVFLSVFVPITCYFYCYGSVVQSEVRYYDTSSIGHFDQDCFGYSRSFDFPYVF
jgi:hypothetical protein